MLFRDVLNEAITVLQNEKISDAVNDAWLLAEHELSINHQKYYMDMNISIDEAQREKYMRLVNERAKHIPLQHITGHQEFMGIDFIVNENVLIPRQDTELLVEKTLELIEKNKKKQTFKILDMCTGSGCIAVSVKKFCEKKGIDVDVTASDISEKALKTARKNALNNETQITFVHSDLFEKIEGKFDYILSNPPYIPTKVIEGLEREVKEHEPFGALDGHDDGLYFYRIITKEAAERILPDGCIIYEIGYDQADEVSDMLRKKTSCVKVYKDLANNDRVVVAEF